MAVARTQLRATEPTFEEINQGVLSTLEPPTRSFFLAAGGLALIVALGTAAWGYQIYTGLGVTGMGQPVMWAFYITNFVVWVGLGHSGTLISAVLYLFRSRWRPSVYRAAETMTVFALTTAGIFPILHLGRAWFFYWLAFYPNERVLQPDFHSPLVWDAFAIGTYLTVSVIFLYLGAIPDLAAVAAASAGVRRTFYRMLSLGWQGTDWQWRNFSAAYLLLAGLATPLVISVHSVVSFDFAMGQLPGWHDTIFAPYFVASAIYSGLGMVIMILIVIRRLSGLHQEITPWHFDQLGKLTLLMSLIISYAYLMEAFFAWYSMDPYEQTTFSMRYFGPMAPLFWLMVWSNSIMPLALFSRRLRRDLRFMFILGIFADIGVWCDHFVIIAGSLTTNFMPSQWGFYRPSWVEGAITAASIAFFTLMYIAFARIVPVISLTEIKQGARWLHRVRTGLRRGTA
jgi:Ni/Fe-hydrogenase subunit HybB-like protein